MKTLQEKRNIEDMLQQMIGFKIGKWDDIIDLILNAGLTKREWETIKKNEDSGCLDEKDIIEINEHCKKSGFEE